MNATRYVTDAEAENFEGSSTHLVVTPDEAKRWRDTRTALLEGIEEATDPEGNYFDTAKDLAKLRALAAQIRGKKP